MHCRQYVYYQTPVLPLPVTLADILKLFRWTDGELIQVGTNARTYNPMASIPAGYYELRPVCINASCTSSLGTQILFRLHRAYWSNFSINRCVSRPASSLSACRMKYDSSYFPRRPAPTYSGLPPPGQMRPVEKVPRSINIPANMHLVILLRCVALQHTDPYCVTVQCRPSTEAPR